ncbi:MAG: hypothetical protein IJ407_00210 [Clostridia bacterium]|nr:hypothetical protein [Clostridia bacterium]
MKNNKSGGFVGFWEQNKMIIIGLIGVVLLISFFNVQNVLLHYETEDGEQYVVRLDYTVFGMCMRCASGSTNASNIVVMDSFTFKGRTDTVGRAANALVELSGTEEGTFQLQVNGAVLNNEQVESNLVAHLQALGYRAEIIE